MTNYISSDEFEAMEDVVPIVVGALWALEARIDNDKGTAAALRNAAESLLVVLDALAAMQLPEQVRRCERPWHIN